jgi:hypothetical protein
MSEQISKTTSLGNAFLVQEDDVMDMVQELRAEASAQGNLTTTAEQTVIAENETIIIEPASPGVIYVPYYDPLYIYGPWWYPAYPPYYWWPPGISVGVGIAYWPGVYLGFSFGSWSYFDWPRRYIYIDVHKRPRYVRHNRWIAESGRWHHAPEHRRGVAYRDKSTARKYGQNPYRSRDYRRDSRGFPDDRTMDVGLHRPDRTGADQQDRAGRALTTRERDRQEQTRIERDDRDRREQVRVERELQERQQAERDRQARQSIERDRQERSTLDRDDRDRQERVRVERELQERQRFERSGPASDLKTRQRLEREEPQQGIRDNLFNRVEEGWRERESSERGRSSRQGRGDDSRGRDWSGDSQRNFNRR